MFYDDDRLLPSHIALYMALFQVWNEHRFENPISFYRSEIMKMAKINSYSTFTKCLRDLNDFQYLQYLPSHNPLKGSKINFYNFCTTESTTSYTNSVQVAVQPSVQPPYINNSKQINNESSTPTPSTESLNEKKEVKNLPIKTQNFTIPSLEEITNFFQEKNYKGAEAEKFFNYFQSNGWKVGGKAPMKDWQAAARNWMLNTEKFNHHANHKNNHSVAIKKGNLHTTNNKDYSEPL